MSVETVRLLHVEDDPMYQTILAHYLESVEGVRFDAVFVTREDEALAAFERGGIGLVILDYMLDQGNGLHLLQELRARDRVVPIIAMSGSAPSEVATELIQSGADDFFNKQSLDRNKLIESIRTALTRAEQLRRRTAPAPGTDLGQALAELCQDYARRIGPDFMRRLDAFEAAAPAKGFTPLTLEGLVRERTDDPRLLRPLLLELGLRLFGDERRP